MLDFKRSIRPIFYFTSDPNYPYATHGGTMFIVKFKDRHFGLTCKHVMGDFDFSQLFVSRDSAPTKGTKEAPIHSIIGIPRDDEIRDVMVITFDESASEDLFKGDVYIISEDSIGISDTGHILKVSGYLKEKTEINYEIESIFSGIADLEFRTVGLTSKDPFIRQAVATYYQPNFQSITGISGAPVFDVTTNRLCGMAARGNLSKSGTATLWFIDMHHIVAFIESIYSQGGGGGFTTYIPSSLCSPRSSCRHFSCAKRTEKFS